jgi:hypothetical protein
MEKRSRTQANIIEQISAVKQTLQGYEILRFQPPALDRTFRFKLHESRSKGIPYESIMLAD